MKTKDCVVTLPITPFTNPGIGLAILPFLMDVLKRKLGLCGVLSLNVNGVKLRDRNIEQNVFGYLSSLRSLDVIADFVWRDDQGENIFWVNKFFHQLAKRGYIVNEMAQIMKCDCGAVESLVNAENVSRSRALYCVRNNKKYCKLCNAEIKETQELVYLFKFPGHIQFRKIFPGFYLKEIGAMISRFRDYKFLISRSRSSALALWTGEKNIFLDVDFIWQMFLSILYHHDYNPTVLVSGNRNLMASCFSMTMFNLVDQKEIDLIVSPHYTAPLGKDLKGEEYILNNLILKHNFKSIRLLLATAINWHRKELIFDLRLVKLISRMSYRVYGVDKATNIKNVLIDLNGIEIKNLLAQARGMTDSFYSDKLFGIV